MQHSSIDWPRFVNVIRDHRRILLTSHLRPDCDALGSELGMAGVLDALGKEVMIVNPHPTPPNLSFIDPGQRIRVIGTDVAPADIEIDLLMVLDTSAWAQLGAMGDVIRATKAKKIVLDHHVSADDLGAEEFKDTRAEATGRLVVEAATHLHVPLTREIAYPLYAAIATDTGWFRFGSTSGDTYRFVGGLVDVGVRPEQVWNELYERDTLARLQLRGRILARTQTDLGGRLIHTAVLRDDFDVTGALGSDTEDVINLTLSVAGTEVAVIFVEQSPSGVKISFRSRAGVDCSKLAEQFGGGGHKAAAGASLDEPLEQARRRVLDVVRAAMQ